MQHNTYFEQHDMDFLNNLPHFRLNICKHRKMVFSKFSEIFQKKSQKHTKKNEKLYIKGSRTRL